MHLAGKQSPTISIQLILENVKDIPEFAKRIPIDKISDNAKYSKDDTIDDDSLKERQFEIIQKNNPADVDYLTWIRKTKDINTFEEALADGVKHEEYDEGEDFDPSYTWDMAQKAIRSGKITVFSSYPIRQSVFVTPSRMEAMDYSGNGKVYSKTVALTDVAWIDPTQGQYANVNENDSGKYSKDDTIYDLDDDADELLFTSDGDLSFDAYGTNAGKVINVEQLMQEQGAEHG